jgi:polyisoprenoid-binding protein YceI
MKKHFFTILLLLLACVGKAQLFSTATGTTSFFSKTPVEDIQAASSKVLAVCNIKTGELAFSIANTSFEFPNKLMQEHFNEKYMESDKYPNSTFKGKIKDDIDLTKDGDYKVTVSGKLNVHGVEKERDIEGVVKVHNGMVHLLTDFKVKVTDHNIAIPKLVVAKIAEVIDVKVDTKLQPKK